MTLRSTSEKKTTDSPKKMRKRIFKVIRVVKKSKYRTASKPNVIGEGLGFVPIVKGRTRKIWPLRLTSFCLKQLVRVLVITALVVRSCATMRWSFRAISCFSLEGDQSLHLCYTFSSLPGCLLDFRLLRRSRRIRNSTRHSTVMAYYQSNKMICCLPRSSCTFSWVYGDHKQQFRSR